MKHIDRLILKAKEQDQRGATSEIAILSMVEPTEDNSAWSGFVDLADKKSYNRGKVCFSRRIELAAAAKEAILAQVRQVGERYTDNKHEFTTIICDDFYC